MLYCSTDFIVYGYTCTLGNWSILKIFRIFLDVQSGANDIEDMSFHLTSVLFVVESAEHTVYGPPFFVVGKFGANNFITLWR